MADPAEGKRREVLLLVMCGLFVGFFVTAELLGAKLWTFTLLGIGPAKLGLGDSKEFVASAGILAFPLTFVLTDIINEYFGRRIVRIFTWLAIAVNVILQPVVQAAIRVPAISFTPGVSAGDIQVAYNRALGQTWAIVVASLIAFSIAQFIDAWVFTWLRHRTGGKMLWLRSQGSTAVSQVIDTVVVIFLAFVIIPALLDVEHMAPQNAAQFVRMSWGQATNVALTNYVYKFAIAVGITPILYLVHGAVEAWLGKETAERLAHEAHPRDPD